VPTRDPDHDLDLAVELINTHVAMATPPDHLTDTAVYRRILEEAGDEDLAAQLRAADLGGLRSLRTALVPIFGAPPAEAAAELDRLLCKSGVTARLADSDGAAKWAWGADQTGMAALRCRLLGALAEHLIRHGTARLGVCHAPPCRCVYVDRSRARTRRYCCDKCNDRAAASAYRERQRRRG
jgi:predicted RNA-binding Zn ribbon-like protein